MKLTNEQREAFNAQLTKYANGAYIDTAGQIILKRGSSGLYVSIRNGRMQVRDNTGDIYFSAPNKPDSICSFVESFWFWKPTI